MRVLNTRPSDQAAPLSQAIRNAGGIPIELPTLKIEPTDTAWLSQLPTLTEVHQAIFTSPNAVTYFYTALEKAHLHWPDAISITTIGMGTAQRLRNYHLKAHYIPSIADSEHLLAMPHLQDIKQQRILLIKGVGGRTLIVETLIARQAKLHPVNVYARTIPKNNLESIHALWREDAVDIILFTSYEAMRNLCFLLGDQAKTWMMNKPCIVISRRLALAAYQIGIKNVTIKRYDNMLEGFQDDEQPK